MNVCRRPSVANQLKQIVRPIAVLIAFQVGLSAATTLHADDWGKRFSGGGASHSTGGGRHGSTSGQFQIGPIAGALLQGLQQPQNQVPQHDHGRLTPHVPAWPPTRTDSHVWPQPGNPPRGTIVVTPYPSNPPRGPIVVTPYPSNPPTNYSPTPSYLPPQPAAPPVVTYRPKPTPAPNVIPTVSLTAQPKVQPRANTVQTVAAIPKSVPPMKDRVYRLDAQEAKLYVDRLAQLIADKLTLVEQELVAGPQAVQLHQTLKLLRETLAHYRTQQLAPANSTATCWQTVQEPCQLMLDNPLLIENTRALNCCRDVCHLFEFYSSLYCCVQAGLPLNADALPVSTVPVGVILILYDPTLPAGTGLLVDAHTMICGTATYDQFTISLCSVAEGLGLPVCRGIILPDITEQREQELRKSIVLCVPKDAISSVNYVLNDAYDYTMSPGEQQTLPRNRAWFASYDQGNNRGLDRLQLEQGMYSFRILDDQWKLVPESLQISLDNTESDQDFTVVIDDRPIVVKAGELQTVTSQQALVMKYDRGGNEPASARKLLNKSGTLKLGVDPATNSWDWVTTAGEVQGTQQGNEQDQTLGSSNFVAG